MTLASGSTIGPYVVEKPLDRGAMADVYEARDPVLDRRVALKILAGGDYDLDDPEAAARFEREARIIARLTHEAIVPIFGSGVHWPAAAGDSTGMPWMAMRLVAGGNVAALLHSPVSPAKTLAILKPVAAALDYAHSEGVVHRDVKPENILLETVGAVQRSFLTDFGIARTRGSSKVTHAGFVLGSPKYMSPEQAAGRATPASDIYSLGVVAYEMLQGSPPFDESQPHQLFELHATAPVPAPHRVPPAAQDVLLKCLAKDARERWSTAQAFVQALESALTATSTRPVEQPSASVAPPRRPLWAASAVLFASILAAVVLLGFVLTQGFSWTVLLVGGIAGLSLTALGAAHYGLSIAPSGDDETAGSRWAPGVRTASALAAVVVLPLLAFLVYAEPGGARLVIHAGTDSTIVPDSLTVSRGLTTIEVPVDASGRRFVLEGLRCGTWKVQSPPGVLPVTWNAPLPRTGERRHETTLEFHGPLANVRLRATDAHTGQVLSADWILQPVPFGIEQPLRTGARPFDEVDLEVGSYTIKVEKEGYQELSLAGMMIAREQQELFFQLTPLVAGVVPVRPPATQERRTARGPAAALPAGGETRKGPAVTRPSSATPAGEAVSPTYDNLLFNARLDCASDPQAAIRYIEAQLKNTAFYLKAADRDRAVALLNRIKRGSCP